MATIAKTVVATGVSSGTGIECLKQLLQKTEPYRIIMGARNTKAAQAAIDGLSFNRETDSVTVLPAQLSDMGSVKSFAQQTLEKLGQDKLDYLLLNAAMNQNGDVPGPNGSRWCEPYFVNHLSQFYLVHLLRDKLVESKARIVFVSSGAVTMINDPSTLEKDLTAMGGQSFKETYCASKFVQLLGAQWWRRQLKGQCRVVAVSPGLIANTGLGREVGWNITLDMKDAKSPPDGGKSTIAAMFRDDFPEDENRMFLTSWGEWWDADKIGKSYDTELQDKWSPSKDEIGREAGITS